MSTRKSRKMEEMATIGGYIDKVNPGETVKLSASATVDFEKLTG